ncbi:hypothetical protein L6250_02150 [Candidatus Parcubacteria bacterium]|nr:hypothetical protein [Patescibacteria group bacterium]MBU4466684.1 hypothetical protein [Patescibacteria group bacterium]MCG2688418.1 hypothetical protein [Candidatus Parcubacteria bacterium]
MSKKTLVVIALLVSQLAIYFGASVVQAATLNVDFSASPSSGPAPLNNVSLTAVVSGTATGLINYKFDCTNDGTWDLVVNNSVSTTYTASNLCNYSSAGTYTAKVRVERGVLSFEGTTAIFVTSGPDLSVVLSANPSSGPVPLNGVDLTAAVSGSATGNITYKFDCTSDGGWESTITTATNPYTAVDLCNYATQGNYTATVQVQRGGLSFQGTTAIVVQLPLTLGLSITAAPSSGRAPVNGVDLSATVSGTTTGNITYRFDCTNDGVWDATQTTSQTTYTAIDLCNYTSPGVYGVKVKAERSGSEIQGLINIVVGDTATLAVNFSATPYTGSAPLSGVDLIASVSGTATGNITYKFDCTSDGSWDLTQLTSQTSYTAVDLCSYSSPGTYTSKARIERGGITVEGTASVLVF